MDVSEHGASTACFNSGRRAVQSSDPLGHSEEVRRKALPQAPP